MEVYINGEWGTVCGYSLDPLDSKVVCRQLGYKGVNRTYFDTDQHNFGEGTGRSWLRGLRCTGSEANLLQCPHHGVGVGCSHSWDVGVVCTNETLPDKGEWMCLCACMPANPQMQSCHNVFVDPLCVCVHVCVVFYFHVYVPIISCIVATIFVFLH